MSINNKEIESFCKQNDPIAKYEITPNHVLYIHGTVYEIETELFVSELFGNTKKYHQVKMHKVRGKDSFYFILDDKKYFLDTFSRP